jgi:hypothetical protein
MAPRRPDPLKVKEARQKKLLLALTPVLLGLLAWQGPKTFKALTGGNAAPAPPVAATTTVSTTTGPSSGASSPAGTSGELPDTDVPLAGDDGELISFNRFVSKDPFRQVIPRGSGADASASEEGSSGEDSGKPANTAVLEVNGDVEGVSVGDSFPASGPVFRLVSIAGETAEVGLVTGSFSNGEDTIRVGVGETLVLVSDPDQARYAIKLISVAFVKPA